MKIILAPKEDGDRRKYMVHFTLGLVLGPALKSVFGINTLFQLMEEIRKLKIGCFAIY